MKNFKNLIFCLITFSFCGCDHPSSEYTFLNLNSSIYSRRREDDSMDWKCYYENVLLRRYGATNAQLSTQMKKYILDSAVQLRVFSKEADTIKVIFWKNNNRTAYFINHKEDGGGGLDDKELGDVHTDFLGEITCGNTDNNSEKSCVIKVYDYNVLTGTKTTDSFTLILDLLMYKGDK